MKEYIVVATNASRAKCYILHRKKQMKLLATLEHKEGRFARKEISAVKEGSIVKGTSYNNVRRIDPATDVKKLEKQIFAKQITEKINSLATKHKVVDVVLIAAPELLGSFHPSKFFTGICLYKIPKNVVALSDKEILDALPQENLSFLAT